MTMLFPDRRCSATFSECRTYRYELGRRLSPRTDSIINFIMLNPSTADEERNDPTVERCERRALAWGFDEMVVTNLFAYRATDPRIMKAASDPVGPENDRAIWQAATSTIGNGIVVCDWGQDGLFAGRSNAVVLMLRRAGVKLHYLKMGANNQPCHPLYLSYSLKPQLWEL